MGTDGEGARNGTGRGRLARAMKLIRIVVIIAALVGLGVFFIKLNMDPAEAGKKAGHWSPERVYAAVFLVSDDEFGYEAVLSSAPVTHRRGKTVVERWNVGVLGPAFGDDPSFGRPYAGRSGDTLDAMLPLFTDRPDTHWGIAYSDPAQITLYRDGQPVGESPFYYGFFEVPPEAATYLMAATATRTVSAISTRVDATWTFRSGHVPDDGSATAQALPLMAVRFTPDLDDHNRARAGRPFTIPVHVQRQTGAPGYGRLTGLTVQVSYDDGRTWRPVELTGAGLDRTANLRHPASASFVSLRAKAVDSNGNAVEQTIVRAYALK